MTVRKRIRVSGRVQGVFFRDSCRRFADERRVAGSATNLPDGRVEVVAEGDEADVAAVVDWCRKGTSHSTVTDVEVTEEEPQGLSGFSIS